jgi:hypothetical protein
MVFHAILHYGVLSNTTTLVNNLMIGVMMKVKSWMKKMVKLGHIIEDLDVFGSFWRWRVENCTTLFGIQ